jgi:hypothetical protein
MPGGRYHVGPGEEFERRLEQQRADRGGPRRVTRRRQRRQRIRTVAVLVVGLALLTVAVVLAALLVRP